MELLQKTATEQHKALINKEISACELVEASIDRINKLDDTLGAFNSTTFDTALETAKIVDKKIAQGEKIPYLAGIPLALKDNMNLKGVKTTCSSKILENFVSPYDATITEKLKENLVPILGKTNLDEFAMGSSNENSAFRIVKNPYNLSKVPGGSSGGSACSVSASEVTLSLGSDTGGSIRLPASFCGIVGFKPTYGRVSRYGVIAFASSLDQVGPITKTVEDNAILLEVLSGADCNDETCENVPVEDYTQFLNKDIRGMKIGVVGSVEEMLKGLGSEPYYNQMKEFLKQNGAEIVPIEIENMELALPVYYIIAPAEATSNLARYDGVKYSYRNKDAKNLEEIYKKSRTEGFGREVKRRIMLGNYVLSSGYFDAYYNKARALQAKLREDMLSAFTKCDVILMPTTKGEAYKIGEKVNPIDAYKEDMFTVGANITGVPAISVPFCFGKNNLPVGMQFLAPHYAEGRLYRVADFVEKHKEGK